MSRRCGDENFRRRNIVNNPAIAGGGGEAFDPTTVLTKTNEEAYTPTGDYNPATKKYVDTAVAAGGGGTGGCGEVELGFANWQGIQPMSYDLVEMGVSQYTIVNNVLYFHGNPQLNLTSAEEGPVAIYRIPITGNIGTIPIMAINMADRSFVPASIEYNSSDEKTYVYITKDSDHPITSVYVRFPITGIPLKDAQV